MRWLIRGIAIIFQKLKTMRLLMKDAPLEKLVWLFVVSYASMSARKGERVRLCVCASMGVCVFVCVCEWEGERGWGGESRCWMKKFDTAKQGWNKWEWRNLEIKLFNKFGTYFDKVFENRQNLVSKIKRKKKVKKNAAVGFFFILSKWPTFHLISVQTGLIGHDRC